MLAQAPPYHGRISETLARYAVIQSSQGLAGRCRRLSLTPPPGAKPHTTHPLQVHLVPQTRPGSFPRTLWSPGRPYYYTLWLPPWRAGLFFFFFCFLPLDAPPPMWLFPPSLRPHHPSRPHTSLLALPSARTPTCTLRPILHRTPSVVAASFGKQVCPSV